MQKRIEAFNLVDFIKQVIEASEDGYKIDFNDNASVPFGVMGHYRTVMHKGSKVAALLKPKSEPEVVISKQVNGVTAEDIPKAEPFVPSIVFEVKEPTIKPRGRPKASQV